MADRKPADTDPLNPRGVNERAGDFLALVQRARRGRLKVYIGFAAGVGKTYQMLREAHALHARGVNVVLGFIETHGRKDTEALVAGLPLLPRRRHEYKGVIVEELDLDGLLKLKPEVAVIDEVPHTNLPGSRNRKRYQDISEILDAGINVICALNVQHLESLNDLLERVTGVVVREKVPDSFLQQADQVVNIDLAVEDLLDRLRAGQIYPKERVPQALERFFQETNLISLRELALREVAESLERQAARTLGSEGAARQSAGGRVMVCMSSYSPIAPVLLRRGSRLAGRLNTAWFVVYVQTPEEDPLRIDSETQRHLHEHIELARELGAEVVRIQGSDPVEVLIDFARSHGVGHILLGRSHRAGWRRRLGLTFDHRMLNEASDFDLHIVAATREEKEL